MSGAIVAAYPKLSTGESIVYNSRKIGGAVVTRCSITSTCHEQLLLPAAIRLTNTCDAHRVRHVPETCGAIITRHPKLRTGRSIVSYRAEIIVYSRRSGRNRQRNCRESGHIKSLAVCAQYER